MFLTEDFSAIKEMNKIEKKYPVIKFKELPELLDKYKPVKEKGPKKKNMGAMIKKIRKQYAVK